MPTERHGCWQIEANQQGDSLQVAINLTVPEDPITEEEDKGEDADYQDTQWEVEDIIASREGKEEPEFLIKWKGYR